MISFAPASFSSRRNSGDERTMAPAAAQAIDRLRWQVERCRQVIQVLEFRLVLERGEGRVYGIEVDVRRLREFGQLGIFVPGQRGRIPNPPHGLPPCDGIFQLLNCFVGIVVDRHAGRFALAEIGRQRQPLARRPNPSCVAEGVCRRRTSDRVEDSWARRCRPPCCKACWKSSRNSSPNSVPRTSNRRARFASDFGRPPRTEECCERRVHPTPPTAWGNAQLLLSCSSFNVQTEILDTTERAGTQYFSVTSLYG